MKAGDIIHGPFPFPWKVGISNHHCPFCGLQCPRCGLDGYWSPPKLYEEFHVRQPCKIFGVEKPKLLKIKVGDVVIIRYPMIICPMCGTMETLGAKMICGFTGILLEHHDDKYQLQVVALCDRTPICTCDHWDLAYRGCTCGAFQKEQALRENSP